MDVLYPCCAGLDVHKKSVLACRIGRDPASGQKLAQTRTFSTMTSDLLALSDWLSQGGCTHVAMESTGEYWKPVYNLLEDQFELLVVNARHIKSVPGRKTDVNDAQWIAELLQHGLLRASFVPPVGQRALRDLTRHRSTFIRERATLVNRVQKVLEGANIKLACVASDGLGVSGRAILEALVAGEQDPQVLAELSRGRLRDKREQLVLALSGRVLAHHRLILSELLCQIDSLDESVARFDEAILEAVQACAPFEQALALLDSIPGVARATAELILSEVGADMSRFASAGHLAAWAGVAPGNHESGGKRLSGRVRQGNRALRAGLVQAAHAAARMKRTYLSAQYHRLAARRGKKRAILAVAHSILVSAYHMLVRQEAYHELGHDYLDQLKPQATAKRLVARLESLGFAVTLQAEQALPTLPVVAAA
jgi:transposase